MKAKTTKITTMAQKDSYGNTSFVIELDNGDKGFYTSRDEQQKKFVIGQETEYNIEKKEGKKGSYFKITLPGDGSQKFSGSGKPQIEPRIQMISFAMSYTKDLVVAGKVPVESISKEFDNIYKLMISKL